MSADARQITPADLIPDAEYARQRADRRAALLPIKRLRRVHLGPVCTFIFETYETMLFQVQEMLLTEKGGAEQVPDELAAYNPLIPQGRELVATVMFEIEDPVRREQALARMGGVEHDFFLQIGDDRAAGAPEGDVERTREDGKTSSVHFLRFPLSAEQVARFRDPATQILVGCSHEAYSHLRGAGEAPRLGRLVDILRAFPSAQAGFLGGIGLVDAGLGPARRAPGRGAVGFVLDLAGHVARQRVVQEPPQAALARGHRMLDGSGRRGRGFAWSGFRRCR